MAKRRSASQIKKIEYPVCVRHLKSRKDVRLRHYFLCDRCTAAWTKTAFDGNAPLACSAPLTGYCQHCNVHGMVCMRTWFLCDICDRVAKSIGRNHVAELAIMKFWTSQVQAAHPQLAIVRNDESELRARRETDVSGEGPLDFLVSDTRSDKVVLGIENKTGRSSIREMSAFQLDISDCDSILHHVRELGVPAYLIHAQVLEVWEPPTVGYRCEGLWWSDIYTMAEHFTDVRMRRDESRGAAYFKKKAFSTIDTLPEALFDTSGKLALVERFKQEGIPVLYEAD